MSFILDKPVYVTVTVLKTTKPISIPNKRTTVRFERSWWIRYIYIYIRMVQSVRLSSPERCRARWNNNMRETKKKNVKQSKLNRFGKREPTIEMKTRFYLSKNC